MLPFNVAHLGQSAYGLWILVASVTVYFSMLDMGYGVAQVRFVAKYRAHGDTTALNEVTSTMFCIFSGVGLFTFILAILISLNLDRLFPLTDAQVRTGQVVLLCISAYVALGFPFSVFGGIVNGFQRQYMNGAVAFATAIVVAGVNIIVLLSGYGLAELVASTTAVRILSYFAYALNAYRVFPGLRSEEHTSELQSRLHLVCRLLLEKKNSPPSDPSVSPKQRHFDAKRGHRQFPFPLLAARDTQGRYEHRCERGPVGIRGDARGRVWRRSSVRARRDATLAPQSRSSFNPDPSCFRRVRGSRRASDVSPKSPHLFSLTMRRPPRSTLFPYTTLFR